MLSPLMNDSLRLSRRAALGRLSSGFGLTALSGLMANPVTSHRPKAKNVILCYMSGGVSHLDSFDHKPRLQRDAGKPMPMKVERTQFNNNGMIMPGQWNFKAHGKSGLMISEMFPKVAEQADDLCVVRSMTAKFNEHAQGNFFAHSGFPFLGHPSAGAWASYGLGTESANLPGYVVLKSGGSVAPHGGAGLFGNGFLPANHGASIVNADGDPAVRNIRPREGFMRQRKRLDFVNRMDAGFAKGDADVEAAIENYEMAFRMQAAVPELCDIRGESEATRKLYGLDDADTRKAAYARQCLLARRLVERGVRFVELTCLSANIGAGGAPNPWDQHGDLKNGHGAMAQQVDGPMAALLVDLKARGLLDETIVIWMGEFGRTPFSQGGSGRDHNPYGFSVWMAGGGFKGGHAFGTTDEYGYHVIDGRCDIYDLWATVLHQLGLDHEELTYLYAGRNVRLTDVHGRVMRDWIA